MTGSPRVVKLGILGGDGIGPRSSRRQWWCSNPLRLGQQDARLNGVVRAL
jgi:hypothetical protein